MRPRATFALAAGLLCTLLPAPADAHCLPGTDHQTLPPIPFSSCTLNQPLEDLSMQVSAASGFTVAIVFVKDFTFHPEVVTVRSGGTVVFKWLDEDWVETHQPQSSGLCANAVDPLAAPRQCVPSAAARCFSRLADDAQPLDTSDDAYPVTFRYDGATGLLEKSRGILSGTPVVGEPPLAQAFRACPGDTSYRSAGQAVMPYHCQIHGGAATPVQMMRGAIVVLDA
jgi:plastocyanin